MPTVAKAKISLDFKERLEERAVTAFLHLLRLCESADPRVSEIRDKFVSAISDIDIVRIEQIDESYGSFYVDDRVLRLSETQVAKFADIVIADAKKAAAEYDAAPEVLQWLDRTFTNYLFHEVRHRTQGIGDYQTVKDLRLAEGDLVVAELDVLADRDAAAAYALLYQTNASRSAYLDAFREALYFSTDFFFRAFPLTTGRADKLARAIGVILMTARLTALDVAGSLSEPEELPLDAPLLVRLSTATCRLEIYRAEPSKQFLGSANDQDGVGELISHIESGRIDRAISTAIKILKMLGIMK